jgi:hypothetical protein
VKRLILFLLLVGVALGAPTSVQNNLVVQNNGTAISGVLLGNGTTPVSGITTLAGGTTGQVLTKASGTNYDFSWTTDGGGTVTSVGLSLPAIFSVSGSPVTGSGTLTTTLVNQPANLVWAGPSSGPDAPPTFRSLVVGDLPSGAFASSITGTANQVLANGTSGSAQTGAITLTTPQDIATTSSPTFANPTVTSLNLGATTPGVISGSSGTITLTGSGTNQNITLAPSGSGLLLSPNRLIVGQATTALNSTQRLYVVSGGNGSPSSNWTNSDYGIQSLTEGGSGAIGLGSVSSTASQGPYLAYRRARGTLDSLSAVSSGDTTGLFLFSGWDGGAFRNTASIGAVIDAAVSSGNLAQRLELSTGTTTSRSVRMTIASGGDISMTNALSVTGVTTLTGGATIAGPQIMSGIQALSGAGAVNVTQPVTAYTSTGAAQALTLANGTAGQIKTIVHDVDGGSGLLTPTTKTGFSTITFTNAGDTVTLQYFTTRGWMVVGSYGVVIAP